MLILFDLDNTLIDDRSAMEAAIVALQPMLRPGQDRQQFLTEWTQCAEFHYRRYLKKEITIEAQRRARMKDIADRIIDDDEADALTNQYMKIYQAHWKAFDDVLPCLDDLRDHPLGIISNAPQSQQRQKLTQGGILDRFDFIVTSDEMGCAKPDARIFLHACAMAGVDPADTAYVGDNFEDDALGSSQAGLNAIWLNRANKEIQLPGGIKMIPNLKGLRQVLNL